MPLALALDLGTTSIGAVAINEQGELVAKVLQPNSSGIQGLPPGHAEQAPLVLEEIAWNVLGELSSQLREAPHCLGITGQMHGMVASNRNREPLLNLITWQDRRSLEVLPKWNSSCLEAFLSRCQPEDLECTGCRLSPGYLAMTGFTLQQLDQIPSGTHCLSLIADWIAARLTGEEIVTDRSNAASTGCYDLVRDEWSIGILSAGELPREWFPDVRTSGEPIGGLTAEVAERCGLPVGLPVCNAIGDNQAAVLGSVPPGISTVQINIGTGGQINWVVEEFLRIPRMDTRYLPHDRYMLVGAGLVGGDAYAWVSRTVRSWLEAFGVNLSQEELYATLNRLAASAPPNNDGLICQPTFRGTRHEPGAKGHFEGITPDNFTLGHVSRAVLQGIATGLASFRTHAGEVFPHHADAIMGTGNGLRNNPLLAQLIATTFGKPVLMPTHQEEAAYGTALLAGSMTGLWPDLKTASSFIQHERVAEPAPE